MCASGGGLGIAKVPFHLGQTNMGEKVYLFVLLATRQITGEKKKQKKTNYVSQTTVLSGYVFVVVWRGFTNVIISKPKSF